MVTLGPLRHCSLVAASLCSAHMCTTMPVLVAGAVAADQLRSVQLPITPLGWGDCPPLPWYGRLMRAPAATLEHEGAPLIVTAGEDGAVRSWRLDGSPGPLHRDHAHAGWIMALATLEHEGAAPLIVTAGYDGAVWWWRVPLSG
jgi:hypothetical protein